MRSGDIDVLSIGFALLGLVCVDIFLFVTWCDFVSTLLLFWVLLFVCRFVVLRFDG